MLWKFVQSGHATPMSKKQMRLWNVKTLLASARSRASIIATRDNSCCSVHRQHASISSNCFWNFHFPNPNNYTLSYRSTE